MLRELMHMGQIVQSHGMHFFELAGPDLLLGFDAAPEVRNVVGLMPHPERACELAVGSADGLVMFQSVLKALTLAPATVSAAVSLLEK